MKKGVLEMRRYKAVVIDGKKWMMYSCRALLGLMVAVLMLVSFVLSEILVPDRTGFAERTVTESIPAIKGFSKEGAGIIDELTQSAKRALVFVLGFDVGDQQTVIYGEIPFLRSVSRGYLAQQAKDAVRMAYNPQNADTQETAPEPQTPENGFYPIKEVDSGQKKALGDKSEKILIRNETEFGINIQKMLDEPLKFDMKGTSPKVLIVHTHATECYTPTGVENYDSSKSDRSLDSNLNVTKVGEVFKNVLEQKGIAVIHDKTLHDHPNFNGSYENSRKTVERYLEKHPQIAVVLDIHRDAFVYDDGSKAKFVTEIEGEKTAQLMFVVGTNAGGLEHPNWRENMKLALKLQNSINKKYPSLMRGVNLRKERFNGHLTTGSLIIEVGSSGNTLQEAMNGAEHAASVIGDFFNTLK
ncbi:MAG: stage II sporulation protein P [Clostridia bacterium]|nr:stage II sporulation protein P [Clostridia bacterium]